MSINYMRSDCKTNIEITGSDYQLFHIFSEILEKYIGMPNTEATRAMIYEEIQRLKLDHRVQDTMVYYLQKEMVDGDVFFLITGDTLEMPEEFGSIMDALFWLSGKSIPVKVVYLLSDGEEIDASALSWLITRSIF